MKRVVCLAILASSLSACIAEARDTLALPDIGDCKKTGASKTFNPKDLFDYINGAADSYLWYCFRGLAVQQYAASGGEKFTVEVYEHCDDANAYGIYCTERPSSPSTIDIGLEGHAQAGFLAFVKGRCYVKLLADSPGGDAMGELLIRAAAEIAESLAPGGSGLAVRKAFPGSGKVAYSEKFFPRDYLGHSFLARVHTQAYVIKGKRIEAFIMEAGSGKDAQQAMKRLTGQKKSKRAVTARVAGNYLVGIVGEVDRKAGGALLDRIQKGLQ